MKRFISLLLSLFTLFTFSMVSLQAKTLTGTINVNTASVEELMQLPGIGKVKAESIVSMRKEKPFANIEDLQKVKGIGAKRLESLKPYIVFSGNSNAANATPASSENTSNPSPASSTAN